MRNLFLIFIFDDIITLYCEWGKYMEKDFSEIPFEKLIEQNRRLRFIIKLIILVEL